MLQWNEERLSRTKNSFKLTSLMCGSKYSLRMCAFNNAGTGDTGPVITSQTEGGKPLKPIESNFIEGNVSTVTLNLKLWDSNGCTINSFSIEYKETSQVDWLTVGNAIHGTDKFEIIGLWPGKKYKIKVQAINNAGTTTAEYVFKTPQNLGVTLSPNLVKIHSEESPFYSDPSVILPVIATLLTLLSAAAAAVTMCFRKKRESSNSGSRIQSLPKDSQNMVTLDNKTNLAQREQYYAAVHKSIGSPIHDLQCEPIPEYPDDISPYATFHVATQQVNTNQHLHNFMYHNHVLTAMETMPMKSANLKEDYIKGRIPLKGNKCLSAGSDYSGSTTDQWSEPRPERVTLNVYTGNSVQGESSSSPEQSPLLERRTPFRHKHIVR
ncbi:cell adhesion molecule Dscam2 isoform X2 [Halyomorpha halys]